MYRVEMDAIEERERERGEGRGVMGGKGGRQGIQDYRIKRRVLARFFFFKKKVRGVVGKKVSWDATCSFFLSFFFPLSFFFLF